MSENQMMKKSIQVLLFIVFIISTLFAQNEIVGFEFNQHSRYIDTLRTTSNIWSMNYRNQVTPNTRYGVTLGLDYTKFFENDTTINPMLKSDNRIFIRLEGLQKFYNMYIKGAIQYYSIKGHATEITTGFSEVLHDNTYQMFEFPLGAGFTVLAGDFELFLGINKTLFYGTNEKEIIVTTGGKEASLGFAPKRSFRTELDLGLDATVIYHFKDNFDLEANFIKYQDKDFSLKVSIWGPLKRMLYIN